MKCFRHWQVNSFFSAKFDIARVVSKCVVGNHVALFAQNGEEDTLRCSPLVCRYDMFESEDALYRITETVEAPAARIGFVTPHDACPLFCAHGRCAAIG
jgi:hypothetical protein